MTYFRILLCGAFVLYAQNVPFFPFLNANAYTTLFPIDPAERGKAILQLFNVYSSNRFPLLKSTSEFALQTTLNGFIPFVNGIFQAPSGTMLIVSYRTTATGTAAQNIYVAIPVEQIQEIIYSDNTITNTKFTSTIPSDVLPYYSVNLGQRASDIQNVVTTFNTVKPYQTSVQRVSIKTTLNGSLYYAPFTNGTIPNVQSVSVLGSGEGALMLITYWVDNTTQISRYIIVSPEQVISVNYCPRNCGT